MRLRHFSLFLLSLFVASCCGCKNDEMTRYHEDGRAKPIVAVVSMIDTTTFDAPWSISEELTTSVVRSIAQSGSIYVKSHDDWSGSDNPFGADLAWAKREFMDEEFVVFMELVEHEAVPAVKSKKHPPLSSQELATNLNMAVRVRVVDLRGQTPRIVLQEMIRDSYYIPRSLLPTDYNVVSWGSEDYKNSPMGIAHTQLVLEISGRLSDYILLAKSR